MSLMIIEPFNSLNGHWLQFLSRWMKGTVIHKYEYDHNVNRSYVQAELPLPKHIPRILRSSCFSPIYALLDIFQFSKFMICLFSSWISKTPHLQLSFQSQKDEFQNSKTFSEPLSRFLMWKILVNVLIPRALLYSSTTVCHCQIT